MTTDSRGVGVDPYRDDRDHLAACPDHYRLDDRA
jgi:hypothetical protein